MPEQVIIPPKRAKIRVSLVGLPEAMASSLCGIHDVLNCFGVLGSLDDSVPAENPFQVEFVAPSRALPETAWRLPVPGCRPIEEIGRTDIVIVPSVMVEGGDWVSGRYPGLVTWLRDMHSAGSLLCSACSGVLLLAETGLLDGLDATIHWAYAPTFRRNFPAVRLRPEKVLVATGQRMEFVMSGASASWHDLVLYLVARQVGPTAAQAISRFFLLQWHADGQGPYVVFQPPTDHGDAAVLDAQEWLSGNFTVRNPVEEVRKRTGLAERSFKRRFTKATRHSPIGYVQQLRVEEAKRRLERTGDSIEEISWRVGYEDPAFFRRLFKRITGVTPGVYRRTFRIPDFARPGLSE